MHASNPERIQSARLSRVWGLNPGPADNRFRLSVYCANEPLIQTYKPACLLVVLVLHMIHCR